jgi:bifunctional non-homologous end joining protein LigD
MLPLRTRRSVGFIQPCLPSPAERPPSGAGWIHEIKHDGFRIMARRDGAGDQLISRHGNDFTSRFPLAAAAVSALSARWFLIDGEAICPDENGLAVFDLIHKRHGEDAVLIAFDLIELDGEDLRRTPIEQRKRTLAKLVRRPHAGIVLNEVFEGDGDILFAHACKLGCEASCRSASTRFIAPGVRRTGSRSRTRKRQRRLKVYQQLTKAIAPIVREGEVNGAAFNEFLIGLADATRNWPIPNAYEPHALNDDALACGLQLSRRPATAQPQNRQGA